MPDPLPRVLSSPRSPRVLHGFLRGQIAGEKRTQSPVLGVGEVKRGDRSPGVQGTLKLLGNMTFNLG